MAVDPTYPSVVQRRQDGNLYVPTGKNITLESGASLIVSDGAYAAPPVTVMATTSGTITNYGLTTIGTTVASAYTLAVPAFAGQEKTIACTVHGATTVTQVINSGAANFRCGGTSTAATSVMTFTSPMQCVTLKAASTAVWIVTSNVNAVAFS